MTNITIGQQLIILAQQAQRLDKPGKENSFVKLVEQGLKANFYNQDVANNEISAQLTHFVKTASNIISEVNHTPIKKTFLASILEVAMHASCGSSLRSISTSLCKAVAEALENNPNANPQERYELVRKTLAEVVKNKGDVSCGEIAAAQALSALSSSPEEMESNCDIALNCVMFIAEQDIENSAKSSSDSRSRFEREMDNVKESDIRSIMRSVA